MEFITLLRTHVRPNAMPFIGWRFLFVLKRQEGDRMTIPRLANEFGDPKSAEYLKREKAFQDYNTLLVQNPKRVKEVLAALATDDVIERGDYPTRRILSATETVLLATNHGTQIGFDPETREETWAKVHDDQGHKEAAHAVAELGRTSEDTPENIRRRRIRGYHTLKVVASLHEAGSQTKSSAA